MVDEKKRKLKFRPELLLKLKAIWSKPAVPPIPEGRNVKIIDDKKTLPQSIDENCCPLSDLIGTSLFMVYSHDNGEESERRITVQFVYRRSDDGKDTIYMRAWCHETEKVHTFCIEQIIEVVDPATFKTITDQKFILSAFALVADDTEPDLIFETRKAIKKHSAELNVLKFIACCDDHYAPEEEEIIIHFIREKCLMMELDEVILSNHIKRLYPDRLTYFRAVDVIAADKDLLDDIVDCSLRLIEADGFITREERSLVEDLKKEKNIEEMDEWVELELTTLTGIGPIKIHT